MDPFDLMCPRSRPVKSTTASDLDFDESLIDRILGTPDKIAIPERYIPEEEPQLEPEEEKKRSLKAERICRLLSKSNGGNLPLVLPPPPLKNHLKPIENGTVQGLVHSSHSASVPSSPSRRLVSVKKNANNNTANRRRPTSSSSSLCDWSLAGVIPPSSPQSTWSRDSGIHSNSSISASERLFGAPVPPAFGIGDHSPIPYEKGVVIGGSKVDYYKASVHHQPSGSSLSQSSSSGRSSASADREDLLHLQQFLAREVTEKSRVVAIRALATSPSPSSRNSVSHRYRDPSPPSPVELPTVQQREATHLHSTECNDLIKALQDCHQTHKFQRFIGICNDANSAMLKCLKKERESKRKENHEKSKAKYEKIRQDSAASASANQSN